MTPIDAVTGLPKSPDIAKLADTAARQGDMQSQVQSLSFSREVTEKARAVSESPEVAESRIDAESGRGEGSASGGSLTAKEQKSANHREKKSPHPTKGKILDIRGA